MDKSQHKHTTNKQIIVKLLWLRIKQQTNNTWEQQNKQHKNKQQQRQQQRFSNYSGSESNSKNTHGNKNNTNKQQHICSNYSG